MVTDLAAEGDRLHAEVQGPSWDTKARCSCGATFASRAEQWKHAADSLRPAIAAALRERDTWQMRAEEAEEIVAELKALGSDEINRQTTAAIRVWLRERWAERNALRVRAETAEAAIRKHREAWSTALIHWSMNEELWAVLDDAAHAAAVEARP